MIFGDPRNPSWQDIPIHQTEFHLRAFLQTRGYFSPRFEERGQRIEIWVGEKSYLREIIIPNPDAARLIRIKRNRKLLGSELNPQLLNDVEKWVTETLQNQGHACPTVKSFANPALGRVTLEVDPGDRYTFPPIDQPEVDPLDPRVLRRFDAFYPGYPYSRRKTILSEMRNQDAGNFENATFSSVCENGKLRVEEHVIVGEPRLLSLGIGYNTEEQTVARAAWKSTRLGRLGSSLSAEATASFVQQKLDLRSTWHVWAKRPRFYLQPSVTWRHRNERKYEDWSTEAGFMPFTQFDSYDYSHFVGSGPLYRYLKTVRGKGKANLSLADWRTVLEWISHDFEYFRSDPNTGAHLKAFIDLYQRGVVSPFSAAQVEINGELLENLFELDPPLYVLGVRGGLNALGIRREVGRSDLVPPDLKTFLGGSNDVRGFGRQELPAGGEGALTSAFLGVEGRLAHTLPVDPFIFVDAGMLGMDPISLDDPIYWSPGLGLRWHLPFGTLRASLAHGFVAGGDPRNQDELSHLQFYINFWEEF